MRIGLMSDTHDNIWALADAIEALQDCEAVLHCGDLISPFVIKLLGDGFPGTPVHIVWGNNDGDLHQLARAAEAYDNLTLHGALADLKLGEMRIAINHYPEVAGPIAASGRYDLVAYGHDHTAHEELIGECLLLNPGEVMGLLGRRTVAVVSFPDLRVEFTELP